MWHSTLPHILDDRSEGLRCGNDLQLPEEAKPLGEIGQYHLDLMHKMQCDRGVQWLPDSILLPSDPRRLGKYYSHEAFQYPFV
jgi:hypothetical protein